MQTEVDINLLLFDRFRHVGRLMRTGWAPGTLISQDCEGTLASREDMDLFTDAGFLKREMVLAFLAFRKEGMKQRDIADEIRVSPSTISEMVGRLQKDGYVERVDDPKDHRAKKLILTEKGCLRAEHLIRIITAALREMFGNLDMDEKEDLIRLLDKMLGTGENP